jgi:hypothetical protein
MPRHHSCIDGAADDRGANACRSPTASKPRAAPRCRLAQHLRDRRGDPSVDLSRRVPDEDSFDTAAPPLGSVPVARAARRLAPPLCARRAAGVPEAAPQPQNACPASPRRGHGPVLLSVPIPALTGSTAIDRRRSLATCGCVGTRRPP